MVNVQQFRNLVLDPTLKQSGLYFLEASDLLLGTALVESNLEHLKQIGGGPALGFFQMEPETFDDIFYRYLCRGDKDKLRYTVRTFIVKESAWCETTKPVNQLITNLPWICDPAKVLSIDRRGQLWGHLKKSQLQ